MRKPTFPLNKGCGIVPFLPQGLLESLSVSVCLLIHLFWLICVSFVSKRPAYFHLPERVAECPQAHSSGRSHNCGCIFPPSVAMARESPAPTTSPPPGSSITPRWQGSPPEAWWRGGPVLLHCGMQWGWQQCVGGRGPAGRVWAGCYTVCRLPRSWGRYGAGMAGEFFSGSPGNGCPLSSPTARRSTLHLGPHLMDSPPAALGVVGVVVDI